MNDFWRHSQTPFQVGWMGSLTAPGALAFRLSQRMGCKGFQTPRSWWSQNILCLLFRPGHVPLVPNRFSTTEPGWQSRQASCHPCHPCPSLAKVIRSHLAYWDRTLNVSQTILVWERFREAQLTFIREQPWWFGAYTEANWNHFLFGFQVSFSTSFFFQYLTLFSGLCCGWLNFKNKSNVLCLLLLLLLGEAPRLCLGMKVEGQGRGWSPPWEMGHQGGPGAAETMWRRHRGWNDSTRKRRA